MLSFLYVLYTSVQYVFFNTYLRARHLWIFKSAFFGADWLRGLNLWQPVRLLSHMFVFIASSPSLTWLPSWWRSWWTKRWKPSRSAAAWTSPSCRGDTTAVVTACQNLHCYVRAAARVKSQHTWATACLHNPTFLNRKHQILDCGIILCIYFHRCSPLRNLLPTETGDGMH